MSTATRTHAPQQPSHSRSPPSLPSFHSTFGGVVNNERENLSRERDERERERERDRDRLPPLHSRGDHDERERERDARFNNANANSNSNSNNNSNNGNGNSKKRSLDREDNDGSLKREPSPTSERNAQSLSPPDAKKRRVGVLSPVGQSFGLDEKPPQQHDQRRGSTVGLHPQRPSPPLRRTSTTNTNTASPPQSHPHTRSPPHTQQQGHTRSPPQPSHTAPSSSSSTPQQTQPSHANTLPTPSSSFSTSRRKRQQSQSQSDMPRMPAPILTSSPSTLTNPSRSSTTPSTSTFPTSGGPPKPLTLAPRRLGVDLDQPIVHSAPVNGGFRIGSLVGNMGYGGPGARGAGAGVGGDREVSFGGVPRLSGHRTSLSSSTSNANAAPTTATGTGMRVPEIPPVPITPGGRRASGMMVSSSLSVERERERERGANIAISRGGGLRTPRYSTGGIAVPPTPAFGSITAGGGPSHHAGAHAHAQAHSHGQHAHHLSVGHGGERNSLLHPPKTANPILSHHPHTQASSSSSSLAVPPAGLRQSSTNPAPPSSGERETNKASFLHLFEDFYDALADSKLLKGWLQEQLTRSGKLVDVLEGQVKKHNAPSASAAAQGEDVVMGVTPTALEEMLERKLAPLKNEMEGLRKRVGELEEMLYRERVAASGFSSGAGVKGGVKEGEGMDVDKEGDGDDEETVVGGTKIGTSAVRLEVKEKEGKEKAKAKA
ncbi:hypothetical protein M422DRAFT_241779 [Sphaerobolus stellatus SS14]|nr:hypothetical protein M422DRAFT_241779 [Sphaerobolus stellatus SS14]